ncbi:MAG: V-type ATP synthase subunit A, partial [Clostridia bacterium]|nr:V-type ATP synthase subunit A [Clostridia bacterium]
FHETDTYTSASKQYMMMKLVTEYYKKSKDALEKGADIEEIVKLPVREKIGRFKYVREEDTQKEFGEIMQALTQQTKTEGGEADA